MYFFLFTVVKNSILNIERKNGLHTFMAEWRGGLFQHHGQYHGFIIDLLKQFP